MIVKNGKTWGVRGYDNFAGVCQRVFVITDHQEIDRLWKKLIIERKLIMRNNHANRDEIIVLLNDS